MTAYARYVKAAAPNYCEVRFFLNDRLVDRQSIREGRSFCYLGPWDPAIQGWKYADGTPAYFPLRAYDRSINLYAITDTIAFTMGNLIYVLGYAPTRNHRTFEKATVAPASVRHDQDLDLYLVEAEIPYLRGTEWVTVCPPDSEDECHDEYVRCQPLRREVQPGKVIIQMLEMPQKEFHIGLRIHDYVNFDDIQPEETDMTREQLKALLGGILPTRNEEFNQAHTMEPTAMQERTICLEVENLLTTDVPDIDTADKLSRAEHIAWGRAGFSYDHHEDGKLYLKIGRTIPQIALRCFTRIFRSTEIGE